MIPDYDLRSPTIKPVERETLHSVRFDRRCENFSNFVKSQLLSTASRSKTNHSTENHTPA